MSNIRATILMIVLTLCISMMICERARAQSDCDVAWLAYYGIPSDLNLDCYVDLLDLAMFVSNWLVCNSPTDTNCTTIRYCKFADPNTGHTGTQDNPWSIEDLNAASFGQRTIVECWGTGNTPICLGDGGQSSTSRVLIRQRKGYPPAILDFGSINMGSDTSGIDTNGQSFIDIQGLMVKNLGHEVDSSHGCTGIHINKSEYISLKDCIVTNIKNSPYQVFRVAKTVYIEGSKHVSVEGGTFSHSKEGIFCTDTQNVSISNAFIEHHYYYVPELTNKHQGMGVRLQQGNSDVTITNCDISHVGIFGIWMFQGSNHTLVQNNRLHDIGATGIITEMDGSEIIVRNNTVYRASTNSAGEGGIWFAASSRNLCENNIVYDSGSGITVQGSWYPCRYTIVRNNIVHSNNHDAYPGDDPNIIGRGRSLAVIAYDKEGVIEDDPNLNWAVIYNNSLYANGNDNWHYGSAIYFKEYDPNIPIVANFDNIFVKNNIVSEMIGKYMYRLWEDNDDPNNAAKNINFSNNHYYFGLGDFSSFANWDGDINTFKTFTDWKNGRETDARGGSSNADDPSFIDPDRGNLRLKTSSPCIDQASYLTTVVSAGSNTIEVKNSKYFMDGYGIPGVDGDVIAVFDSSWQFKGTCQITNVNYETDILAVDFIPPGTALGDYVIYAKDADGRWRIFSRPDIGAYEYN